MLSHVDKKNFPTMVDVSDKTVTRRTAVARATVVFPEEFSKDNQYLKDDKSPMTIPYTANYKSL